jgi:hypothetical protein
LMVAPATKEVFSCLERKMGEMPNDPDLPCAE